MKSDTGFTVVEFVIAAVILFMVSTSVMGVIAYAGTANAANAMRQSGLELANLRMEQARNLSYSKLGTASGIPTGTIETPEIVTVPTAAGDRSFTVVTDVGWVWDADGYSTDKKVTITVSWTYPREASVTLESAVVGEATGNTGDVYVYVVDSDTSDPVPGATITIKPTASPTVSATTGSAGYVRWGKVPTGSIVITGTCSTHYLDMSPVSGATVIANQKNIWTVQGVRASSGTVHVTDNSGNPLPGVAVTITGPAGSADWSCPSGTGTAVSDENGDAFFEKLRKGTYTVSGTLSGYSKKTPVDNLVVVAGGSAYTSSLVMNRLTTLKVTVKDASNNAIQGATCTATGVTFGATTDSLGQATSNDMGAIGTNRSYTVSVAKAGYITNTGTVTMSQYTQGEVTVVLSPQPPTTIRVTVTDTSGVPISGATCSATGGTTVVFASLTDANGVATSNNMGAIGTGKTYTVTAAKTGWTSKTGTVTLSEYTQGTLTIQLSPPAPTTIKVTVTNNTGTAQKVVGATITATGPSTVTFPAVTDSNGQATSNNMGAIGTNKTYTVRSVKSGWVTTTGNVTLSEYTQGTLTIKMRATLEVLYNGTYPRTIYVYTSSTPGATHAYTQIAQSATIPASFNLPSGTYWVSRRTPYGGSGAVPQPQVVTDGALKAVTAQSSW
ncbi:MAG: hypothetical protein HGB10_04670 [Coriobacteriia bacterium]|nr:hypothetical protein [Coriobacteriia bacterium]